MTEAQQRQQASRRVLLATFWLTVLVLAVKVWVGWSTRSLCLLAESLHTLIDSFSIILSLITVASPYGLSDATAYGHGKLETTGVLLLVAFLGFTGINLLSLSMQQVTALAQRGTVPIQADWPLIQLLGAIVACLFCLGVFNRYEAMSLANPSLLLNARSTIRDAGLTLIVLVGMVCVLQGFVWIDPLLAISMVLVTVASLLRVLTQQLPLLVEHIAIAPETLARMACAVEGVTYCDSVQSWGIVGRGVFVRLRLVLQPEFLIVSNIIAERLEKAVRDKYGPVSMLIYIDSDRDSSSQQHLRYPRHPEKF